VETEADFHQLKLLACVLTRGPSSRYIIPDFTHTLNGIPAVQKRLERFYQIILTNRRNKRERPIGRGEEE
jgi:hypothetical protein